MSAKEAVLLRYKQGPSPDPATFRLARLGALHPVLCRVPADPDQAGPVLERLVAALESHGYPEELVRRFQTCAGEAVPNALCYGRRGSMVSVLLILFGSGRHRLCVLTVENELERTRKLGLPEPRRLHRFGRTSLHETHGRGFPLMRKYAEDVYVLLHPDHALTTILSFCPRVERSER